MGGETYRGRNDERETYMGCAAWFQAAAQQSKDRRVSTRREVGKSSCSENVLGEKLSHILSIRMVFARVSEGGGIESIGEVEGQRAERGEIVLREKSVESKSKRQKNGNVYGIKKRGDNSARRGNGRNGRRK
jgi:hypothetical protein